MARYILHRLLILLPVLILVSVFCFSLLHLIPGDPIDFMFSDEDLDDAETRQMLEKALGLDMPLWKQYFVWVGNAMLGDFGQSIHFERPNAEFTFNDTCQGLTNYLNSISSSNISSIKSYQWNLGNGQTATSAATQANTDTVDLELNKTKSNEVFLFEK